MINYDNLDINTSDIWRYELENMQLTNDYSIYDSVLRTIEPIIADQCQPFLNEKEAKLSKYALNYPKLRKKRSADYFLKDGQYYELGESVIILLEREETKAYGFLFALKLRQYRDNLFSVDPFLYHQLRTNFNSDLEGFYAFLKVVQIQHQEVLEDKFEKIISLWKENFDPTKISRITLAPILNDPSCWVQIDKHISDERARAFFSFLYEERLHFGRGFLEKRDFDQLFRFGLKVPPIPLPQKVKLNTSPKYRKIIVESCTYKFFRNFASNQKNKMPYLYFLAYQIEDFAHVKTSLEFKNWGKNFTEKKMQVRLPFDIKKYIDRAK